MTKIWFKFVPTVVVLLISLTASPQGAVNGGSVRKGAANPISHHPDFRVVVGVDGVDYAVMLNSKCLHTSASATIPSLETATTVYEAIALTKGVKNLREMQTTVMNNTRCVFADYTPRWLEQTSLPYPGSYAIHPPPNQTSACSLLEMFEVYGHSEALYVPFETLDDAMSDFVDAMNNFVQEWAGELKDCLKDRVDGVSESDGTPQYTFRTFLYSENFPGVLHGPFSSQFWSLPYLLHQSPRRVDPMIYLEEPKEDSGTMPNFLRSQTRPHFERSMTKTLSCCNSLAFQATAVHSDALMATSETLLDLLLTSNLIRFDCSPFHEREEDGTFKRYVPQGDFVTCSGCMAFYKLFYDITGYAMQLAFTAKKVFNRIRPEQFAHRIALFSEDDGENATSCLTVSQADCDEAGLSDEVCELALAGEPFDSKDLAAAFPFFDSLLRSDGAQGVLDHVRGKQDGCLLLQELYPEGAPSHDAYPGGHSVFAGAAVSGLAMMFCMYDDDDICFRRNPETWDESKPPPLKKWRDFDVYQNGERGDPSGVTGLSTAALETLFGSDMDHYFVDDMEGRPNAFVWEGKEDGKGYKPSTAAGIGDMTVWGELVKYSSQYTHARDRAGVHYYSDGCAGQLLGEIAAIRYMIEELRRRPRSELEDELELIVFPLLDGRHVVLSKKGYRFWGKPESTFRNRVNQIPRTSPMRCGGSMHPVKMREGLSQPIPEQVQ